MPASTYKVADEVRAVNADQTRDDELTAKAAVDISIAELTELTGSSKYCTL